ncbi:Serine carboxypeptidase-like 34 [Linum perenne]
MQPMGVSGSRTLSLCLFLCLVGVLPSWGAGDPETFAAQSADRVVYIPEQPSVNFLQYSGYIPVDENYGKALFYWFFEAAHKPENKPLLIWLNGGPGCSSVGYGAAQEIGPFLVKEGHDIELNPYAWNRGNYLLFLSANLLFLEAPAGVGFSYSNNTYVPGDSVTAWDSYTFLNKWLKRFPQFRTNELFIAGESYAGHYAPQLAEVIFDQNKIYYSLNDSSNYINLKGFMVGNPSLDEESDRKGMIDYAWGHAMLSDKDYQSILANCDFTRAYSNQTEQCTFAMANYNRLYSTIDMYSLNSPTCHQFSNASHGFRSRQPSNRTMSTFKVPAGGGSGYDACTSNYVYEYFNKPDVQEALHANVTQLSRPWDLCSDVVNNEWSDSAFSVLPVIRKLLDGGIRIWFYSGDADARIPVTSTRYSLNKLGLNITQDWTPWYHKDEVGGWTIKYEGGLTMATMRGAGHAVPVLAPESALLLVSHFLDNTDLPRS